jgi:hypothetical protein
MLFMVVERFRNNDPLPAIGDFVTRAYGSGGLAVHFELGRR